jgi:dsRNA-specific ribonuclease
VSATDSAIVKALSAPPFEVKRSLTLTDYEYLISAEATRKAFEKEYYLLLVHPGLGTAVDFFATYDTCARAELVYASSVCKTNLTALDLDAFVLHHPRLPTLPVPADTIVLWDDTYATTASQQFSSDTLRALQATRLLILRVRRDWTPPADALMFWEKIKTAPDDTALWRYIGPSTTAPDVSLPTTTTTTKVKTPAAPRGTAASTAPSLIVEGVRVGLISAAERALWQQRLTAFLKSFLAKFVTAPALELYFQPMFMKTWYDAFTHELVDPNANYETLEFIGDVALSNAVAKYLVVRFPNATKGQYNEMKAFMVEKQGLKQVSEVLGFIPMLLTFKNTQHVAEDIVESFIGALSTISNQLVPGMGDVNVYNYVVWYYNTIDLSPDREGQKPAKTIVQQTVEKFFTQGSVKEEVTALPDNTKQVKVYITQDNARELEKYNITITPVLGVGTGMTQKAAASQAYQRAREYLMRIGMTFEWAETIQRKREFESMDGDVYNIALTKAKQDGYVDIMILRSSTLTNREGTLVGLIGIDANGKKTTLAIGEGVQKITAAKAAIDAYLASDSN